MRRPNFSYSEQSNAGQLRRPGVLIAGTFAVLATGFALGYLLRPGGGWDQTVRFLQTSGTIGPGSLIYLLAAGLALLLFMTLLRYSNIALLRRRPFAGRFEKTMGEFVQEAKGKGVSLRVAREAYDLLQHHYPRPMCIDLNDDLRRHLRMTDDNILSLYSGLLGRTDRSRQADFDGGKVARVQDLLDVIEAAPKNGIDRTKMRQRVSDLPVASRPVVENLEFTESSALTDPDFLRRAHFKWLRRRNADYKGFRSRATDDVSGQEYAGPFRRGTELSRRLAVKEQAGRLAKIAAETGAVVDAGYEPSYLPVGKSQDGSGSSTVYQGY